MITGLKGAKIVVKTAEETNQSLKPLYNDPPYKLGTEVYEFTTTESTKFVRVHGGTNQARIFMMKAEEITDSAGNFLTPEQIQIKFALPDLPTKVSEVTVPSGTKMATGIVKEQAWGPGGSVLEGGATQFHVIWDGLVPEEWFKFIHDF